MNSLSWRFEELPDFRDGEFRSGAHDGRAEISYSCTGEWTVRAIALDCNNGKRGDAARGKAVALSRAYHGVLWEALCDSLEAFVGDQIQDAVNQALAEDGISLAEPSAGHRLRAHERA